MQKDKYSLSRMEVNLPPTRRTFAKYIGELTPCEVKGRTKYYWLADVLKVMPAHLLGITPLAADALDLNVETARLKSSQADKSELDVAVLRGELLPTDVVGQTWADMVIKFRAKILGIPTIAAGQVAGMGVIETKKLLEDLLLQALDELKDYDPDD